jgi:hypothetical protein
LVLQAPGNGLKWVELIGSVGGNTYCADLWRIDSPSPETIPQTSSICKWIAWEMCTQPFITVQETQWREFSLNTNINLPAVVLRTSRGCAAHMELRLTSGQCELGASPFKFSPGNFLGFLLY